MIRSRTPEGGTRKEHIERAIAQSKDELAHHKDERIDLRTTEYVKARIRRAAELTGRTISDFTLQTALEKAEEVVDSVERWELNERQSAFVLHLLSERKERPQLAEFLKKWEL
jgi:uncharacterized protein (DUF1778 family)